MLIVDRVKVSVEGYGIVGGCRIWGGLEGTISPDDDPIEQWLILKSKMELAMSQGDSMKGTVIQQVVTKEDKISGISEAIKSCTTLVALERFRPSVEREDVNILYEAYENKKKQFL